MIVPYTIEERLGCFYYSNRHVTKVYALPEGGAELDAFVADLFKGGTELNFFDASAPSKLFPTIIQAFKVRSAYVNFRPLRLYSAVWPDAAERSIRPCPFCVVYLEQSNDIIKASHATDRYHFNNAHTGQQMTVEFSYMCHPYDEPEEYRNEFSDEHPWVPNSPYWARSLEIVSVRILVDDEVRCRPELPDPPQRQLALPNHGDLLLAVFGFASRDDLDAAQLTCTFWRDVVNDASGTLALRPLQHVIIRSHDIVIQRAPTSDVIPLASVDISWRHWMSNEDPYAFRPEDFPTIMSLLRHGCALRLESDCIDSRFCPIAQHLAGTFRAKTAILQYFNEFEEITSSLQLA
ncbi:hypothetical protein AAVH_41591, partial [Aphelenchoides avenae]